MIGDDARNERGTAPASTSEDELSARLKRLGSDLDATRDNAKPGPVTSDSASSGTSAVGQAYRLSAEFVAGIAAGAIIGWLVDRLVGSSPWGLIVFVIGGFCAGMLNLLRASGAAKPARTTGRKA